MGNNRAIRESCFVFVRHEYCTMESAEVTTGGDHNDKRGSRNMININIIGDPEYSPPTTKSNRTELKRYK